MRYIEDSLGNSVGITRQREGSIDNRETVGGVERSVTQSSHITEELFMIHDFTKLRALEVLLETAKYAYMNESKAAQYIMESDLAQQIYTIDGEVFSEADYGLVMTDSTTQTELKNALVQLAHAGIQNQMLNFSTFMDIYMTPSIADVLERMIALKPRGKYAMAFGSYGWADVHLNRIEGRLKEAGLKIINQSLYENYTPDEASLIYAASVGDKVATKLREMEKND
jgi:hypothetical protein